MANGGNIDLLLVGPPGVVVLDAKHWSTVVSDTGLAVGRFDRSAAAVSLATMAGDVRSLLGSGRLPVEPVLVLTHEANRAHGARKHGEVLIVGLDNVVPYLSSLTATLTGPEVETTTGTLLSALSQAGPPPEGVEHLTEPELAETGSIRDLVYERFNAYYYVQPWARAGRRRLYLNGPDGTTLAYKDLATGVIAVTDDTMGAHVRDLLAHASGSGLALTKATVPKVPAEFRGGRIVSSLTRLWMTFHVGHRWRKGSLDRLYCVRADPNQGVDELGYIDLTDGSIKPLHDRPLGKDLASPQRYLELHRERFKTSV